MGDAIKVQSSRSQHRQQTARLKSSLCASEKVHSQSTDTATNTQELSGYASPHT